MNFQVLNEKNKENSAEFAQRLFPEVPKFFASDSQEMFKKLISITSYKTIHNERKAIVSVQLSEKQNFTTFAFFIEQIEASLTNALKSSTKDC